jgi:hypothetical protein
MSSACTETATAGVSSGRILRGEVTNLGNATHKDHFTNAVLRTPSRVLMGLWFGAGLSVMGSMVSLFGVLLMLAEGRG